MAKIENLRTKESVLLNIQHVFGRSKQSCNYYLAFPDISQRHASIYWNKGQWFIQDHSRNGLLLNGKHVHQTTMKLSIGDKIQFGMNEASVWIVQDLDRPGSYLKSLSNPRKVILLDSNYMLPNNKDPEVFFYRAENGDWKAETEDATLNMKHEAIYVFCKENWMFIENEVLDKTIDQNSITEHSYFKFLLSADEEHIHVKIIANDLKLDLGERVHHNLLLALARKKIADIAAGCETDDQGWVDIDDLAKTLEKEFLKEFDMYKINLLVYRLRKQLLETRPLGEQFINVLERRNGQIRFSHPYFQIIKEGQVECEYMMKANGEKLAAE